MISVVIPVYNRRIELERALNSLKNQTNKNFEVIVVNDFSSETHEDIISKFEHDLDIKYLHNDISFKSPSRPRNIGVNAAKYEWIAPLDSDDEFCPNKIEVLSKIISDKFDFYYHGYFEIRNNLESKIKPIVVKKNLKKNLLKYGCFISNGSMLIKKSTYLACGGSKEDYRFAEDYDLWLRVGAITDKFQYIDEYLNIRHISDVCLSNEDHNLENVFQVLFKDHTQNENLYNKIYYNQCKNFRIAKNLYASRLYAKALPYYLKSMLGFQISTILRVIPRVVSITTKLTLNTSSKAS